LFCTVVQLLRSQNQLIDAKQEDISKINVDFPYIKRTVKFEKKGNNWISVQSPFAQLRDEDSTSMFFYEPQPIEVVEIFNPSARSLTLSPSHTTLQSESSFLVHLVRIGFGHNLNAILKKLNAV